MFCLGSIVDLCHYRFSEMDHKICYFLRRLTTNSFQLQGGSPPDPHQGLCSAPGLRWGHSPHTPIIGSRSRARHAAPPEMKSCVRPWQELSELKTNFDQKVSHEIQEAKCLFVFYYLLPIVDE